MDILQLIEELEDVLSDATNIPFSKKVSIDPDEVFDIIKEIRETLPEEIRQAKWVNDEKDRILQEANDQAAAIEAKSKQQVDAIDAQAKARFEELVSQDRITQAATETGEHIVQKAEEQARQIRESTFAYIDEILANTQENLNAVIHELDRNRQELH
ncbi:MULTISPECIES: hypothetical protein [Kallipyga]|uniref:hypothetical protein n=1 Tax=Kallipyga TaxID=1472763 RepID=UPI0006B5ABF5|nr:MULTISPECIES: hypothetical protein [Kallipyga]